MLNKVKEEMSISKFWKVYILLISIVLLSGSPVALAVNPVGASTFTGLRKDSVVKILAIGNSFSEDAVEHHLYGLAKAGGYRVIIANLYIGGAPLDLHWKNADENKSAYAYRKTNLEGQKQTQEKVSIEKALSDENWDFISLQQASTYSGLFETYTTPLPLLLNYIKQRAKNPKVKYVFHQTWAYAKNSTHKGFENYGNDQMKMYQSIMSASKKAKALGKFDLLVPAGTAIQNARTSFIGDNLCRDGYHLNLNIGRYIASCAWYETLFGKTVVGNTYIPPKVTKAEAAVGQLAAHKAVGKPYKITKLN